MHSLGGVVLNVGSRLSAGGVPRKHAVGLCRRQRNDLFYEVFTVNDGAACFCRWRPADGQSAIRHCFSRPLRGAFLWQIGEMCLGRDAGPIP